VIVAGNWITIYGSGTKSNPYVIEGTQPVIETGGGGGGGAGRLVGEVIDYAGDVAPAGWVQCQGQQLSRAIYSALFAIVGTTYGAGDGVNTFNVPDFRDRVSMGVSGTKPRGTVGGAASVLLTMNHIPQHRHYYWVDQAPYWSQGSSIGNWSGGTGNNGNHQHNLTKSASVGTSGGTLRTGDGSVSSVGTGGIDTQGWHNHTYTVPDHTHYIDPPAFDGYTDYQGQPDGTRTAVPTLPPHLAVNKIIYTGVGVE
jgi:hypothetical protein